MGRRTYNSNDSVAENNKSGIKQHLRPWLIAVIAVFLAIIAAVVIIIVNCNRSTVDNKIDYNKAVDIACKFVDAIDDADNKLLNYTPSEIRKSGVISESMGLSEIDVIKNQYGISISDIIKDTPVVFDDKIALLEAGIKSEYDIDMSIDAAAVVPVASKLKYTVNETDYDMNLEFQIVCVNIKSDWYVYTGDYSGLSDIKAFIMMPGYSMGSVDMIQSGFGDSTSKNPIIKTNKDLHVYDDMISDLTAGMFMIDDISYHMPMKYSGISSLLSVDKTQIPDEKVLLMPGSVFNIPVRYNNSGYSSNSIQMNIVNADQISLSVVDKNNDFIISSVYFCRMDNGEDYPQVYLPGNVTFNTSYDDVKKLYGSSMKTCAIVDDMIMHNAYMSVYKVQMDEPYNSLYLQFDVDNKLVAMQYCCLDVNSIVNDID